ncbi:7TM chemoreceptor [Cooperia oncophora]
MNTSQLVGFYETFEKHAVYFLIQRNTMVAYGITTNIVVVFSLYVLKTSKVNLMSSFRNLMYCNVIFPALACNVVCLLLIPYILVPYPIVLNLAPLNSGREFALVYLAIAFWFGFMSYLSASYSISLNYISVCHSEFMKSTGFWIMKWLALVLPCILLIALTILVPLLVLRDTLSIPSLLAADARNAVVVAKFAPLVLYFISSGLDLWLGSIIVLYITTVISSAAMITRIVLRMRSKKHEFSTKTYRLHLNVVLALLMYCAIEFIQFGLPVAFFVISVMLQLPWFNEL